MSSSSGAGNSNVSVSGTSSLIDRFSTSSRPVAGIVGDAHALATSGLHTLDAFRAAREEADRKIAAVGGGSGSGSGSASTAAAAAAAAAIRVATGGGAGAKRKLALLSFAGDDSDDDNVDDDDQAVAKKKKEVGVVVGLHRSIAKDPSVSTDFLPDVGRASREAEVREGLLSEWDAAQALSKAETLRVVYSYWDGTGHRRETDVTKGSTIGAFLETVRRLLSKEFSELKSSDSLIFVKEDLILPHSLTFYELITTNARGKSGPLFDFDVRDDLRLISDTRVEKEDSHPGKVLDRRWYEKNKHIFPFSRYEVFDPLAARTDYTIKDTRKEGMHGAPSKH